MRILILSCDTGRGHNSCASALQHVFTEKGCSCHIADALSFVSDKFSKIISWGHTTMYRHVPGLFRFGYDFVEKLPAMPQDDAAMYKLLTAGTKQLHSYIQEGDFDTVICVHVFSGFLLRQTMREYPMQLKTAFVATDYTYTPGTAISELDYYFIPAESLKREYEAQGIPWDKLFVSGIPVHKEFYETADKNQAKLKLGLDPTHTHLLMMCGSMGCGPMDKLTKLLQEYMEQDMELSIVCGTNEKLQRELTQQFGEYPNIHILGFVHNISEMMDSADLYLTKPGGLSSTEAAAKRLPMVLIDAVAGCEKHNLNFFVSLGGAVTAESTEDLAQRCIELMKDKAKRSAMADALGSALCGNAARHIYDTLKQNCQP